MAKVVSACKALGAPALGFLLTPPPILAILQKLPGAAIVLGLSYWPGWVAAAGAACLFLCWHLIGVYAWGYAMIDLQRRMAIGIRIGPHEVRSQHFIFWTTLIGLLVYGIALVGIILAEEPLYAMLS